MTASADPLSGLPDFGAPIAVAGQAVSLFAPYLSGSYRVPPQGLTIATNSDGSPQLSLTLLRNLGDLSTTGQYAIFDFTLTGDFALEPALAAARSINANATVDPIVIDSGFTRLFPTNSEVTLSPDLLVPIELGDSGVGYARWTARLSSIAGDLVKGALSNSAALLGAQVEYQVDGVAPRVPSTASFKPAALIAALVAANPGGRIAAGNLASALQAAGPDLLSLQQSTSTSPYQALADRIATSFCTFVPALLPTDPPCLLFNDPTTLSSDPVLWDLSQPARVFRQATITLDQLGGLSPAVVSSVVHEVTVPSMPLGQWSVDITTNLPPHRSQTSLVGISVQVAANPPFRPSSIDHQYVLNEPDDRATCPLQLTPREALSFTVVPYAVVATATDVHNYTGVASQQTDTWVRLATSDFPVSFAHVSASSRLTALANVTVNFSYNLTTGPVQQQIPLNAQAPDVAFPFPNISTGGAIQIVATPLGSGEAITLGPFVPERLTLDLPSFREYGPHRIAISVDQAPATPLVIELLPEAHLNDASIAPSVVFFSEGQLTGSWGYFADSPFRCGYCYRVATPAALPGSDSAISSKIAPQPWSPIQSPFEPLPLHADGTMISNEVSTVQNLVTA